MTAYNKENLPKIGDNVRIFNQQGKITLLEKHGKRQWKVTLDDSSVMHIVYLSNITLLK